MTNKLKSIFFILILLSGLHVVVANPTDFSSIDWGDTFSTFDVIGNVFKNLGQYMQLIWKAIAFWIFTISYFLLVYFLILWLPLHLYPKFIQYFNLFRRVFGISPPTL